jgi:hypothetical protein
MAKQVTTVAAARVPGAFTKRATATVATKTAIPSPIGDSEGVFVAGLRNHKVVGAEGEYTNNEGQYHAGQHEVGGGHQCAPLRLLADYTLHVLTTRGQGSRIACSGEAPHSRSRSARVASLAVRSRRSRDNRSAMFSRRTSSRGRPSFTETSGARPTMLYVDAILW